MSDLISRRAAIDALERKKDKSTKGDIGGFYNKIIQNDIDTLMQLPSAQSEQRWIPCSERLPENVEEGEEYPLVIFCTDKRSYVGFYEYYRGGQWWNYTADEDYLVEGVIAWMPLPEPYREVTE